MIETEAKCYWWIAVNGSSAAASPYPLSEGVAVSPTPEMLIGFGTREEQLQTQRFLLTAPIADVRKFMHTEVSERVAAGELAYKKPAKPQKPKALTHWIMKGANGSETI